jgi:hypothetical protein
MNSRNLFATILTAGLLTVGLSALAPAANAAPVGPSFLKLGESARNHVIEIKARSRDRRIFLPIVPYIAYDYPYYYSRGYYPTHIAPGYVYFGYPYAYRGYYWLYSRARELPRRKRAH